MQTGIASKTSRGQALFETTAFLPLMLLAMVGILYFSQYGVLQERAAQSVRYASLVTNSGTASSSRGIYSLEAMYNELYGVGQNPNASYPSYGCSGSGKANQTALSTLYQDEALPQATATSTAPPFFHADSTPSADCQPYALYLSTSDTDVANSYFVVQYTSITATKKIPGLLQRIGLASSEQATAGMGFALPAGGASTIYCSPDFAWAVAESLGPLQTSSSTPVLGVYGNYPEPATTPATPPPSC